MDPVRVLLLSRRERIAQLGEGDGVLHPTLTNFDEVRLRQNKSPYPLPERNDTPQ